MKTAIASLILGLAAGGTAVAQQGTTMAPEVETRTLSVEFDADEIRTERDAERLFFRFRQAAEEVCRISSFPRGYEIWQEHDCEADAVARAVEDADVPALDEFYYGMSGRVAVEGL